MKLAVFTVMLPDLSPEEAVSELKASGYDGIGNRLLKQTVNVNVNVPGLSLHPGKPVLPTVHITPWSLGLFTP